MRRWNGRAGLGVGNDEQREQREDDDGFDHDGGSLSRWWSGLCPGRLVAAARSVQILLDFRGHSLVDKSDTGH